LRRRRPVGEVVGEAEEPVDGAIRDELVRDGDSGLDGGLVDGEVAQADGVGEDLAVGGAAVGYGNSQDVLVV
jgi:hypothetical protein